jgi:hypothetical protein
MSTLGSRVGRRVYEELKKRSPRVLLPNLSRIYCQQPGWLVDLDILPCFMTDRVTYLNFYAHPTCPGGLGIASQAWNALATRSPFIEHLELGGNTTHASQLKYLGSFIQKLKHLKVLDCPLYRLPNDTIRHLLSLPELRSLQLRIKEPQALGFLSVPSFTPRLHALKELGLFCDCINSDIVGTLKSLNLTSSRLQSLWISSIHGVVPADTLEELIVTLKDCCDPSSFQSLQLTEEQNSGSGVDYDQPDLYNDSVKTTNSPAIIIQASIFKPLLKGYSSLVCIRLTHHLLDANDIQVEEIAAHLPTLQHFFLASNPDDTHLRPRMTLRSVFSFLKYCPSLEILSLYIDPKVNSWPRSGNTVSQGFPHKFFNTLHLGRSPLEKLADAQTIHDLVKNLCPNFQRIYWKNDDDTDEDDYYDSYDEDLDDYESYEYDDSDWSEHRLRRMAEAKADEWRRQKGEIM